MTRLTVPDTIELADVSIYLSANYQGSGNLFGERLATTAPQTIALVADALRWHYDSFPAISITDAVGSITVDNVGNDGDTIMVLVHDVVYGTIILGTYIKTSADVDVNTLASNICLALGGTVLPCGGGTRIATEGGDLLITENSENLIIE